MDGTAVAPDDLLSGGFDEKEDGLSVDWRRSGLSERWVLEISLENRRGGDRGEGGGCVVEGMRPRAGDGIGEGMRLMEGAGDTAWGVAELCEGVVVAGDKLSVA